MSYADIYNVIALLGIILAIVFGVWLNCQTRKVEQDIQRLTRKNTLRRLALRASRLR